MRKLIIALFLLVPYVALAQIVGNGSPTSLFLSGAPATPGTNGQGVLGTGATGGLVIGGKGSGCDVTIDNSSLQTAACVPSGTTAFGPDHLRVGSASLVTTTGAVGIAKITTPGTAPGATGLKLEVVCGTAGGSAKIIAYAGTSTTPVVVSDSIGSGVSGC